MSSLLTRLFAATLLLASSFAHAAPPSQAQIDELLEVSRVRESIASMLPQIQASQQQMIQQMLAGKTYQLLRVWVRAGEHSTAGLFPEISANKYMVWIRFATQCQSGKPQAATHDVPFQQALCN